MASTGAHNVVGKGSERQKRARVYSVDMKPRQPSRYSVTSRLVFATVATYLLQTVRHGVTQART